MSDVIVIRFVAPSTLTVKLKNYNSFENTDFDVTQLPFDVSGGLHYESRTGIAVKGSSYDIPLTAEEIALIEVFCEESVKVFDLPMYAYDPNRDNLFVGFMPVSEISSLGYFYTVVSCDYAVAKFDTNAGVWEKIFVILTDDGSIIYNPTGICDKCVTFMTEKEWDEFEKPHDIDEFYKYDHETATWINTRTAEQYVKNFVEFVNAQIHQLLTAKLSEIHFGKYLDEYFQYDLTLLKLQKMRDLLANVSAIEDEIVEIVEFRDKVGIPATTISSENISAYTEELSGFEALVKECENYQNYFTIFAVELGAQGSTTAETVGTLRELFVNFISRKFGEEYVLPN